VRSVVARIWSALVHDHSHEGVGSNGGVRVCVCFEHRVGGRRSRTLCCYTRRLLLLLLLLRRRRRRWRRCVLLSTMLRGTLRLRPGVVCLLPPRRSSGTPQAARARNVGHRAEQR